MDWKLFWMTFGGIFVAELGDKTQLGVVALSAAGKAPLSVFLGASLALVSATLAGVLAGAVLGRYLSERVLETAGGALFIGIGVWMIFRAVTET